MTMFNDTKSTFNEKRAFMNRDLAIQQRAKFSFLINFKKLLSSWGFENISFDDDEGIISVAGTQVLHVAIDGFIFKPEWLNTKCVCRANQRPEVQRVDQVGGG